MKIKDDVIIKSSDLKGLNKLFRTWIKIIKRYCDLSNGKDAPYWYGERATVSIFAGAVYHCKGLALTDYSGEKLDNKGKKFPGVIDLWFLWHDSEYAVEAKEIDISISIKSSTSIENVKVSLEEAIKEAKKIVRENHEKLIGIVYILPYLPASDEDYIDSRIEDFLQEIREFDCDAISWCFPESVRRLEDEGFLYPGVIMLATVASG